ncbi:hypothetical protein SAMN05216570_2831 [Dyella sp. OK004]|uniref:hypothetical protein n=1 Tax=Dyella sp. OK004 TaxID=1855292 RepID=UPI0008E51355|nr:hypothetical protein [Dyella sp. OK004]SFS13334.1 hypothetical protein SAMN05216570_2831 [Dyella sp. OK004]
MRHGVFFASCLWIYVVMMPSASGDEWPEGHSRMSHTVIGGLARDGKSVEVPLAGIEQVSGACRDHLPLWIQGDDRPHTCTRLTIEGKEIAHLWLSPSPTRPAMEMLAPPLLISTRPFTPSRWKERPATAAEVEAIRALHLALKPPAFEGSVLEDQGVSLPLGPSNYLPLGKGVAAIDTGVDDSVFLLVPGRALNDAETEGMSAVGPEKACATVSQLVFVRSPHGVHYRVELPAKPMAYVADPDSPYPAVQVTTNCGAMMFIWRIEPKPSKLIDYQNGYEYGDILPASGYGRYVSVWRI